MATALKSAPAPLYLPFDRSNAISSLSTRQREAEYYRAQMVALLDDGRQRHLFQAARKGSLFSALELLAMYRKFKNVDYWGGGNLWKYAGRQTGPPSTA